MSWFTWMYDWLRSLFFSRELEITLVGLQNSGKTSLVNVLAAGQFSTEMIPTIGFNMRKVTKGGVTIKLWDLGGQPKFRSMWERYCRGVNAIVFILDSSDPSTFDAASAELHALLERPQLAGIPVLILGNKNDLPNAIKVGELIERFELANVANREISAYSISAKNGSNIDAVLSWLTKGMTPSMRGPLTFEVYTLF